MESLTEIIKYKNTKGKMLYTFLIHSITTGQVNAYLKSLLDKISTIKDLYKRKIANERVKTFELYFENISINQIINSVFLIDSNQLVKSFLLDPTNIKTLVDFKIPNTNYYCDDCFYIDYISKILDNTKLITVCAVDNTNATIIKIDGVKSRVIQQTNIETAFDKYNCELYYGFTSNQFALFTKKYPTKNIVNGKLTKEEAWNKILKDKNTIAQEKFNTEVLTQLTNNDNLYIFGRKNVGNEILNYGVKKLFITSKLYNIMIEKIDPSFMNFEIIILEKYTDGDYTDILIKNFEGLVGIKYY
jgi:hypothetical protein